MDAEPGAVELDVAEHGMNAMRVAEPALLCVMAFLLLSNMLSALFLSL